MNFSNRCFFSKCTCFTVFISKNICLFHIVYKKAPNFYCFHSIWPKFSKFSLSLRAWKGLQEVGERVRLLDLRSSTWQQESSERLRLGNDFSVRAPCPANPVTHIHIHPRCTHFALSFYRGARAPCQRTQKGEFLKSSLCRRALLVAALRRA